MANFVIETDTEVSAGPTDTGEICPGNQIQVRQAQVYVTQIQVIQAQVHVTQIQLKQNPGTCNSDTGEICPSNTDTGEIGPGNTDKGEIGLGDLDICNIQVTQTQAMQALISKAQVT